MNPKKKESENKFLWVIASIPIILIMASFVHMDFDPAHWSDVARTMCVVVFVVVLFFIYRKEIDDE